MPISQQGSGGLKADALTGADHKDLGHGVADLHTVAFEPVHEGHWIANRRCPFDARHVFQGSPAAHFC